MRYLAIDYGMKLTGMALCDPEEKIVSPFRVLPTNRELVGKITEIIKAESVEAVVLGLPLNMDGSVGPQALIINDFAEKFKALTAIPVYFQDERLTTYAAEGKLVERELTRKQKKKRVDALAAAEILQAFLDSK